MSENIETQSSVNPNVPSLELPFAPMEQNSFEPAAAKGEDFPNLGRKSSEDSISIRAVNNDNHHDVERLIELFRSQYGAKHPFKRVFQTDFWSDDPPSEQQRGLVSMVAVQKEQFIAHLAFDCDSLAPSVQLLLPAIHPDHRDKLFQVIRCLWKRIEQTASRQQWSSIFMYNLTSQPMLQLLAAKCFHSEAAALLPCVRGSYGSDDFSKTCEPPAGLSVLAMYNILQPPKDKILSLHPPHAHFDKVKDLFRQFNIKPSFYKKCHASQSNGEASLNHNTSNTPGLSMHFLRRYGLYQLCILPSLLPSSKIVFGHIHRLERQRKARLNRVIVQVALDDPRCPDFCSELETAGYRFCGILPMIGAHNYIAYAKFEDAAIERCTLYTESSKSLRQYILERTRLN